MCDECKESALLVVCHMPESNFVPDLVSLLTDHRMSGRPIRAKCKQFKTNWEQTSDKSPTDSSSFCKDLKLYTVARLSCLPVHSTAQRIVEHVLPFRGTALRFVREVFPILVIFLLLQQKCVIETSSCTVQ